MAGSDNQINLSKTWQIIKGDPVATREFLYQVASNVNQQAMATNVQQKSPPVQCVGTVSLLNGTYIVQLALPGTKPPATVLQQTQANANQTAATNIAPITPLLHQIQAATTPRFDAGSGLTSFGGDTGMALNYWSIDSLPMGSWYFRFRSSYDGQNWNQWKNANGGQALNGRAESVTVEDVINGVAATFVLPGKQLVSFIAGLVPSGASFSLPQNLYSSAMNAIAAPNGFKDTGHPAHGFADNGNGVLVLQPANPGALDGPADFPISVPMIYQDGEGNNWNGDSNIFAFAFDPLGTNVTQVPVLNGSWAVFTLPGGGQLAVGSGWQPWGGTFALPPSFDAAHMFAVASPQGGWNHANEAHGIFEASVTGSTVKCSFQDGVGNNWQVNGQWFAIAYSASLPLTNGFLVFSTPGGSKVAIGAGAAPSGTVLVLPPGFTWAQTIDFTSPASYNEAGHPMHGVADCSINALGQLQLSYLDGSGNTWDGNVNWMVFSWQ
jgi:hypothetical protein